MKQQPEYHLQVAICQWLRIQHPKVLFLSDTIASCRLTIPQQVRNKAIQKEHFKCPDLIILHPNKYFHGLFIELKVDSPFKKNGELKASEHLQGQQSTIDDLNARGYHACFSWGFDMTVNIINRYLESI